MSLTIWQPPAFSLRPSLKAGPPVMRGQCHAVRLAALRVRRALRGPASRMAALSLQWQRQAVEDPLGIGAVWKPASQGRRPRLAVEASAGAFSSSAAPRWPARGRCRGRRLWARQRFAPASWPDWEAARPERVRLDRCARHRAWVLTGIPGRRRPRRSLVDRTSRSRLSAFRATTGVGAFQHFHDILRHPHSLNPRPAT